MVHINSPTLYFDVHHFKFAEMSIIPKRLQVEQPHLLPYGIIYGIEYNFDLIVSNIANLKYQISQKSNKNLIDYRLLYGWSRRKLLNYIQKLYYDYATFQFFLQVLLVSSEKSLNIWGNVKIRLQIKTDVSLCRHIVFFSWIYHYIDINWNTWHHYFKNMHLSHMNVIIILWNLWNLTFWSLSMR